MSVKMQSDPAVSIKHIETHTHNKKVTLCVLYLFHFSLIGFLEGNPYTTSYLNLDNSAILVLRLYLGDTHQSDTILIHKATSI